MPGGRVAEVAGSGVEHPVEDRGALDVLHLPREVVERGEHGGRRRIAQRRGPHRSAQPAHRPCGRHAVADGVTDDERHAPGAEGHRVVPVTAGGT
jgi:hypothetical protein